MIPLTVLISLYKGYGLGDAAQMSAVLRHLRKHRPHWQVDFLAESGREDVGRGHCRNVFAYGEPYPSEHYDLEVQIVLYDTFANWHDRPNTRVTSCLHERFGIEWDKECGRYQVAIRPDIASRTRLAMSGLTRPVAIHYSGDSAKDKKDLSLDQATRICEVVKKFGYTPLILDWRPDPLSITYRGVSTLLPSILGRSVEMNCAVISACSAFIGIDSGPSKCASTTDTPALVIWTGHHPAPFHDPAPNTTHLVPIGYNGLEPVCNDAGVIRWFEANHNVRRYTSDVVTEVEAWLKNLSR